MRLSHIVSGLAVTAAAGAVAVPALAAGKTSHLKNFNFSPASLSVKKNTVVTWKFDDTAAHNVSVTSGPVKFKSKNLAKGKSYAHKFTKAGTYKIVCTIHPGMKQTVKVTS